VNPSLRFADQPGPVAVGADHAGFRLKNELVEQLRALGHEVVAVNEDLGYAGTLDMPWRGTEVMGLMDYKTTKTKPGEPVIPRLTHAMQLAAGLTAYNGNWITFGQATRAQNIFISTTEPGRVDVVEYDGQDLGEAWEAFKACLELWRVVNKHDPRKGAL
jgi:hypothetical protein